MCKNLEFEFRFGNETCSCEIRADGEIWCCDVCSTTLDIRGQLVTEESSRILGFDTLVPRYRSEQHALACGVTEEEIELERDRALAAWETLRTAKHTQIPQYPVDQFYRMSVLDISEELVTEESVRLLGYCCLSQTHAPDYNKGQGQVDYHLELHAQRRSNLQTLLSH